MKLVLAAVAVLATGARAAKEDECCWCDKATPSEFRRTLDSTGQEHELVFSDEFNELGRDLANGNDARWTAIDHSDYTNGSPMRYTPAAVTTVADRGAMIRTSTNLSKHDMIWKEYDEPYHSLRLTTTNISGTEYAKKVNKTFAGGMVQSWNKFCFTGGVVEINAKFPLGAGFWPALWLFGNLGRAAFVSSNDGLWPFSFEDCDPAWEEQPVPEDGYAQRISGCNATPGPGLHPYQGRGATEVDIVEVGNMPWGGDGYLVYSLQVAPSVPSLFAPDRFTEPTSYKKDDVSGRYAYKKPKSSVKASWYPGLKFGGNQSGYSSVIPNPSWYGPDYADCISGALSPVKDLSERYFKFRLEWQDGDGGYLRWFVDDVFMFEIPDEALGRYTACGQSPGESDFTCEHSPKRKMPSEPASIVINTALGTWDGGGDSTKGHLPGYMYIDYVRVWQKADEKNVGCDPPDYPTKEYIEANARKYGDPAMPPGDETCPGVYPAGTIRTGPSGGGGGGSGAHVPTPPGRGGAHKGQRSPVSALLIAALVLGLLTAGVLLFGRERASALVGRLIPGARKPTQYGEVSSYNAPILRTERSEDSHL